jgi:hypothetical protein
MGKVRAIRFARAFRHFTPGIQRHDIRQPPVILCLEAGL